MNDSLVDGDPCDNARDLLAERPGRSGVFLDFDGTLAPIVEDPARARPLDGVVGAIDALAKTFAVVAVISGRPIEYLRRYLPVSPTVRVCGLYGLQRLIDGQIVESGEAASWRHLVDRGATLADAQLPKDVLIERKGLSFVLHFRKAPSFASLAEEWAVQYAASSGLDAWAGRRTVEIGPFHGVDKGMVVEELGTNLYAACVFGDDAGDLPAFGAADRLASKGVRTSKLAVHNKEAPKALVAQADCVFDSPISVLAFLQSLAEVSSGKAART